MAKVVRTYHNNQTLDEEYYEINGKKEGEYKQYYITFQNSISQIERICYYINDKKNGEYKSYYMNGLLKRIFYYIDDKLNGEYKTYYKNGQFTFFNNFVIKKVNY